MDTKRFDNGKSVTITRNLDTEKSDSGISVTITRNWTNFVFNWKSGTIIRDTRKFDSGMSGTRNLDNKKLSSRKHPESGHQEVRQWKVNVDAKKFDSGKYGKCGH